MSGGVFISFEGGEGVGKSTQADLLAKRLQDEGRRVKPVHEPGGTRLGERIRDWVKAQNSPLTQQAELLLFTASRAELVQRVIRPELDHGAIVIADRYADSTTVYQGYARGLPLDEVQAANAVATAGVWPGLTFLLDAPPNTGLARVRVQTSFNEEGRMDPIPRAEDFEKRRFEELGASFHQKVRDGYLNLAKAEPERWAVIDASQTVEAVHAIVWERVREALPPLTPAGGGEPDTAPLRA